MSLMKIQINYNTIEKFNEKLILVKKNLDLIYTMLEKYEKMGELFMLSSDIFYNYDYVIFQLNELLNIIYTNINNDITNQLILKKDFELLDNEISSKLTC